jgi:hypothetical protein
MVGSINAPTSGKTIAAFTAAAEKLAALPSVRFAPLGF